MTDLPQRTTSPASQLPREKEKKGIFEGWFGGLQHRSNEEGHKPKRSYKKKGGRGKKSKQNSTNADTGTSTMQSASLNVGRPSKSIEDSDDQDSETGGEESSFSDDSSESIPSDEFPSRLRELAMRLKEEDRALLGRIERHLRNQDLEIKRMVTAIARMHKADLDKRDNSYFIKATTTLRVLVQNWSKTQRIIRSDSRGTAETQFYDAFNTASLSKQAEILKSVVPSYMKLSSEVGDVSTLMQAYLWGVLEQNIFGKHQWAGDPTTCINLKSAVAPPISSLTSLVGNTHEAQYHEWRALTARLASQNMTRERLEASSQNACQWALEPLHFSHEKTCEEAVVDIFRRALELDLDMSKQKAVFSFSYLGYPSHYNSETMEMVRDQFNDNSAGSSDSVFVDLFKAPALSKGGTSAGDKYEIDSILVPAQVVCSPHQTHRPKSPKHFRRASTMPANPTRHVTRQSTGPIQYTEDFPIQYAEDLHGGYQRIPMNF